MRTGRKDLRLIGHRQSTKQRHNLRWHLRRVAAKPSATKTFVGLANVPFRWQKNQNVTAVDRGNFFDGISNTIQPVAGFTIIIIGATEGRHAEPISSVIRIQRPITNINRIHSPGNLQHRNWTRAFAEVFCETSRINRRRRDDHFQITSLMQQTLEISQQEIDVQRPLMGFVDDNRVVLIEKTIGLSFRQQDPVRH